MDGDCRVRGGASASAWMSCLSEMEWPTPEAPPLQRLGHIWNAGVENLAYTVDVVIDTLAQAKTQVLGTPTHDRFDNSADIVSMAIKGDPEARQLVSEGLQYGLSDAVLLGGPGVIPLVGEFVPSVISILSAAILSNPDTRDVFFANQQKEVSPPLLQAVRNAAHIFEPSKFRAYTER